MVVQALCPYRLQMECQKTFELLFNHLVEKLGLSHTVRFYRYLLTSKLSNLEYETGEHDNAQITDAYQT